MGEVRSWTVYTHGHRLVHKPNEALMGVEYFEVIAKADLQVKIDALKNTLIHLPNSLESAVWDLINTWEAND